jgi:exopolysaccharide biosynthesis polyprenyl glycosylphosphotransferase
VTGQVEPADSPAPVDPPEPVPVLGDASGVADAVARAQADIVAVVPSPDLGPDQLRRLAWSLEGCGVDLVVSPALTDVAGPRVHVRPVAGLPLLQVEAPRYEGLSWLIKSVFDRVAAALGLLALSPVFALIAAAIVVADHGPVFYRQQRVGLGGQRFWLIKFRTMVDGADGMRDGLADRNDGDGPLFKIRDDPRVTSVGRWLRRTSLDELPQLVNVVAGQMSLVGPRPPLPEEVERYADPVHRRLLVKPGITGLWQVSGRSDLSWDDSVRLDLYYVENWSLTGDLVILARTVAAVLRGEGAY